MKKTTFFVQSFDISPCFFTQILSGRARWMWNLILHPMSTHTSYFWWTPLPQIQEIPEKMWWWHHHHFFLGISCFWGSGVHQKYAMWVLIGCEIKSPHPTSSPDRNLSKNTGRYVENTNKKSSFFYDTYPQIYIKLVFKTYTVFQI